MIKLAAFDIDGTLFDERRGEFPASAVEALRQYQDGIAPEQDTIYIDSISITRENLEGVNIYESEGVIWHLYNGNLLPTPQREN